jgi:hypothetical protein
VGGDGAEPMPGTPAAAGGGFTVPVAAYLNSPVPSAAHHHRSVNPLSVPML